MVIILANIRTIENSTITVIVIHDCKLFAVFKSDQF